jgi:hypothetical protein
MVSNVIYVNIKERFGLTLTTIDQGIPVVSLLKAGFHSGK